MGSSEGWTESSNNTAVFMDMQKWDPGQGALLHGTDNVKDVGDAA